MLVNFILRNTRGMPSAQLCTSVSLFFLDSRINYEHEIFSEVLEAKAKIRTAHTNLTQSLIRFDRRKCLMASDEDRET